MISENEKVYVKKHGLKLLYDDIVEVKLHEDVRKLIRLNCIRNNKEQMDSDYVGFLLANAIDKFFEANSFPNGEKKKVYEIDLDVRHYRMLVNLASKEGIVNYILKNYLTEVNEMEENKDE